MGSEHGGDGADAGEPYPGNSRVSLFAGRPVTDVGLGKRDGQTVRSDYKVNTANVKGPYSKGLCGDFLAGRLTAGVSFIR